jgi:hypothetical protein
VRHHRVVRDAGLGFKLSVDVHWLLLVNGFV